MVYCKHNILQLEGEIDFIVIMNGEGKWQQKRK